MRKSVPLLALIIGAGCSLPSPPSAQKAPEPAALPVKIIQFYAAHPKLAPGEQAELCYGVENAASVWVFPPRRDLPAAFNHCFTEAPPRTTTYRLSAQGTDGKTVFQEVTVVVGAARARISEVRVNTLDAAPGDVISLCYSVLNTVSVKIDPIGFKAGGGSYRCVTDRAKRTTTYVVTATGADGETDSEKITVKVH